MFHPVLGQLSQRNIALKSKTNPNPNPNPNPNQVQFFSGAIIRIPFHPHQTFNPVPKFCGPTRHTRPMQNFELRHPRTGAPTLHHPRYLEDS